MSEQQTPVSREKTVEELIAEEAGTQVAKVESLIAQLEASKDETETQEATLATKSPMALVFELVGCEKAQTNWNLDENVPTFTFFQACPFGKKQPDQDCRLCVHHTISRYGAQLQPHEKRYPHAGVVVPVDHSDMEEIAYLLRDRGSSPLQRHADKLHVLRQALETAKSNEAAAKRALLEAQQRGQVR